MASARSRGTQSACYPVIYRTSCYASRILRQETRVARRYESSSPSYSLTCGRRAKGLLGSAQGLAGIGEP
jgi:hypothetical protein